MYKKNNIAPLAIYGGTMRKKAKVKQSQVAKELGYSLENISAFENGRNNNAEILLYYIKKGWIDYDRVSDVEITIP